MKKQFDIIHATRQNFLKLVDGLSIEELNEIPSGFSNNIAWNFGHIIVSQQTLCYIRAGISTVIEQSFLATYQKGTRPEKFIEKHEIDILKGYLFSLIDVLEKDAQENKFGNYVSFTTQFGVELTCIEDAIHYFATHDALHLGYAMAIARHLSKENQFSNFQHIKFSN